MSIMTEETFGPVIPIMKVKDAEEALRLANDSRYGLSGCIFSRDQAGRLADWPRNCTAAPSASTTVWSTSSSPTRPWAAAKTAASVTATAPRASASSASKKPSSSTVSDSRKSFPWYPASREKDAANAPPAHAALSLGLATQTARVSGTHTQLNSLELARAIRSN